MNGHEHLLGRDRNPKPDSNTLLAHEVRKMAAANAETHGELLEALKEIAKAPAPVVNVETKAPVVNVTPPKVDVSVAAPSVQIENPKTSSLSMTARVTKRDPMGNIEEVKLTLTKS